MNIWCISKYASIPKYGTGARLFFLTKEFIKLGHSARLITSDANHLAKFPKTDRRYNLDIFDSVPVHWIKTKKYTKTASVGRVLSWLDFEKNLFRFNISEFEKPDVVIISSLSIFSIIYGLYLKKKFNSFLVFEIRDIWPLTMTEEGAFFKWHPLVILIGLIEKYGYKHSDLVVGTMPRLDLHVKNILGYEKPFFCSPLGFNPEDYSDERCDEDNPFDTMTPNDKVIIGYAGSIGLTNALEAYMSAIELLKDNSDIHFMIVGSGDLKEKFEQELSGCTNVTFLPRIPQSQVKYFLKKCDILYLSTQDSAVWEYGQSMNKVVEYMLAAKPIIASYTGYPSMINEAGCGEFVDIGDAEGIKKSILKYTSMTAGERKIVGEKGRKWITDNRPYALLAKNYMSAIFNFIKEYKK